jgi:hypothetical protein
MPRAVSEFYVWAEDHPLGLLSTLFLIYVAAGSITGSAIAVDGTNGSDEAICWPEAIFTSVYARCDDRMLQSLWFFAVGMPVDLLQGVVSLLIQATYAHAEPFEIFESAIVTIRTTILVVPAAVAFRALLPRAPLFASALLLALIGEIIYLRLQLPDGQSLIRTITG